MKVGKKSCVQKFIARKFGRNCMGCLDKNHSRKITCGTVRPRPIRLYEAWARSFPASEEIFCSLSRGDS